MANGEMRLASFAAVYRSNPWVYTCSRLITSQIGRLPLHSFTLLSDGHMERVRGDLPGQIGRPGPGQQLDNLLNNPSPGMSRSRLVRRTVSDLTIYGNALWTIDRNAAGLPIAVWHVPWRFVIAHGGEKSPIVSYEIRGWAGKNVYSPDDVVHFMGGDDAEQPIGISPLAPLRYTLRLLDAIQRHLGAYFGNAARPSGLLEVGPDTSKENLEDLRETIKQLYTSPENAGKVLVTSAHWQTMASNNNEADIVNLVKLSREEVMGCYQIPPPLAGILDNAIKSNVVELREQLMRDVIGPWAESLESEVQAQLIGSTPAWKGLMVKFDFGEVLRPNLTLRAEAYSKLKEVYAPDEFRKIENLPAIGTPDAIVPVTPLNMRPLGLTSAAYGGATLPGDEPEGTPDPDPDVDPGGDDDEDEDLV